MGRIVQRAGIDGVAVGIAHFATEDKAANKVTDVKGKIKESAGKATNDEELEGKGKGDQAEASVKDGVENLKDAAGNVKDAFKK